MALIYKTACYSLSVDGAQVGVLEQTDYVSFCCLLQSEESLGLESVLSGARVNLSYKSGPEEYSNFMYNFHINSENNLQLITFLWTRCI